MKGLKKAISFVEPLKWRVGLWACHLSGAWTVDSERNFVLG